MNFRLWSEASASQKTLVVCAVLASAIFIIYFPVHGFGFVNYDDPFYIYTNPAVTNGLTLRGIKWALFTHYYDFWHPLTWWSHMLDCQLFGLNPGWFHLENLAFHIANTLLIFIVFQEMTGALWRSAFCAALFGLHPLHVESVAWLSERKDVLSAFFWMLCLLGYVRYVRKLELADRSKARLLYTLTLVSFALALMAKAMVVTLPFFLLLLDYWPLNRFQGVEQKNDQSREVAERSTFPAIDLPAALSLVLEKLPFFGLTIASCVITYLGMERGGNILTGQSVPWSFRITNVPISYVRYLWKMLCPVDLAVLYPIPEHWGAWQVAGAGLIIILITWLVLRLVKCAPYLAFGWFSFLGTLVPTLGIVAVGYQSIADRYTYIPSIGLFAAVTWGVADLSRRWKHRPVLLGTLALFVLTPFAWLARAQVQYWRNSDTLWTQCLRVNPKNEIAHFDLGFYFQKSGRPDEAMEQYRQTLAINPRHLNANLNLGLILANAGKIREATNYFVRALVVEPDSGSGHLNLGIALFKLGDPAGAIPHLSEAVHALPDDMSGPFYLAKAYAALNKSDGAIRYYQEALRLAPDNRDANYDLGCEWLKIGNYDKAIARLNGTIVLAPSWPAAHFQLAVALAKAGRTREAIAEYREVLQLSPDSATACNNLAWILATNPNAQLRNGAEAVQLAQKACNLSSDNETIYLGTLAVAYAAKGDFAKAVEAANTACALATRLGETNLLRRNEALRTQFKNRIPYQERPESAR